MKKQSYLIVVLAFVFLCGLIFWQIRNLKLNEQLKTDNENQEMQSTLLATAIQFRKSKTTNPKLRSDSIDIQNLTEKLISQNFKKFNRNIEWGYFNGLGSSIDSLNFNIDKIAIAKSNIKVCTSCLINISILNDDGSNPDDEGFVLNQTPAQMVSMNGMDLNELRYLHIYVAPKPFSLNNYLLPILFLFGLAFIVIWLLYLNNRQNRLIHQKNEFVNHLSHQFQTPLSSIKLSANLLANNANVNKDELVQIIQNESSRLENHIKTVLHWVKSDADRLQISKEKIFLTDIIEKSLKQMRPVFLTNKTKVNFIPPEDELIIFADRNHLQLMLFNIWGNAIKHNELPIELTVTCKKVHDGAQIGTTDNGVGINGLNKNLKFKGLGLAYINRLMEVHNGSMQLLHIKNSGLTVHLNFPYHD